VARNDVGLIRRLIRVIMVGLWIVVSMTPTLKIDCMASTDCHRSGQVVSKEFMVKSRHHMNENDNYWRIRRVQNDRGNKVCTMKVSYGKQRGSIASVANTNMIPLEDITKRPILLEVLCMVISRGMTIVMVQPWKN
jgi:hypothetical protein